MECNCLVCGKSVERNPSRLKRNKGKVYCSKECWKKDTVKEECVCGTCGKTFKEYPSRIKDGRGKYCTKECANVAKIHPEREQNDRDRDSTENKVWRLTILQRDNFTCKKCGTKKKLQVHHILGFSKYPELRFDFNNGITLCKKCHVKFHSTYGQYDFDEEDLLDFIGE